MGSIMSNSKVAETRVLRVNNVNNGNLGSFNDPRTLETWELPADAKDLDPLKEAAKALLESNIPVGFPTETVYGLGADATRSDAVKGIYKAKGRPSDNPLIIHVCDLTMLRTLLQQSEKLDGNVALDPIPAIYKPLIERFWPGPLTILLPNPKPSLLASEVTAGLPTFGARMPHSPLALSLIHLAGVPLAAPSANASTKPSPTTAEHVLHDLDGKIDLILDGGACLVGVESTVVDGMCDPPVVLRPGGVSIDSISECEGWAGVVKGYKDASEVGAHAPRAPGMKYKHYSPKAKVMLFEHTSDDQKLATSVLPEIGISSDLDAGSTRKFGIVRTKRWSSWGGLDDTEQQDGSRGRHTKVLRKHDLKTESSFSVQQGELWESDRRAGDVIEIFLGRDTKDIAHGLFSALRELDQMSVDVIFVEGIEDVGDIAAAVMNRLRKAATTIEM